MILFSLHFLWNQPSDDQFSLHFLWTQPSDDHNPLFHHLIGSYKQEGEAEVNRVH
jgi:hypothetical protein